MLIRHRGLIIFLLFAVVGHAQLLDLWLGPPAQREPPMRELGFALIFAPILLVLVGEWIADEASSRRGERLGWGITLAGAVWHLGLDLLCLMLPWRGAAEWRFGLLGAAVGAIVMGLVLRRALRGLRAQDPSEEPDPAVAPPGEGVLGRLGREAALVGGTPIAVGLISLGFVGMAIVGAVRRPDGLGVLLASGGFFVLCAAVAVWMGLSRRAMLLGRPDPLARLRPRFLRRAVVLPTREGLAQLTRRGATVYPWDAITDVSLAEVYGNPAVLVRLRDDVVVRRCVLAGSTVEDDLAPHDRWARSEARGRRMQRALFGADLAILGTLTEEGAGVLRRQIEAALQDPAAPLPALAAELAKRAR